MSEPDISTESVRGTCRVFITYSHDSPEHLHRVLALAERLRKDGVDAQLDQYVAGTPAKGWPRWMEDRLEWAQFVLVICTETYQRRFLGREEPDKGKGVDWEGSLITLEMYHARSDTNKFVPVLFDRQDEPFIPRPLSGHTNYLLSSEDNYAKLYAFLTGQAGVVPGKLGPLKTRAREAVEPLTFEGPGEEISAAGKLDGVLDRPSRYLDSSGSRRLGRHVAAGVVGPEGRFKKLTIVFLYVIAAALIVALFWLVGRVLQHGKDYNVSSFGETWKKELFDRQNENGSFRISSDPSSTTQAWTSAQCLLGILSSSALVAPNTKNIVSCFYFLDKARTNYKQGGWGMWERSEFPLVEITAWVSLAYTLSMREEVADAIWSTDQQTDIATRISRDLNCNLQLQDKSGGWAPIDGVPQDEARTYSTIMALWSELAAISTPRVERSLDQRYKQSIFRALYWFQNNFRLELGTWVPKPSRIRQNRRFPGLSAQILYVLSLAQRKPEFDFIQHWDVFKNAKHLFLEKLNKNPVGIASILDDQIETQDQAVPPAVELEGSTFLAFPWTLKACQILKMDTNLSITDRDAAAHEESRLRALLPEWNEHLLNATTESFEIAESLAALVSDP